MKLIAQPRTPTVLTYLFTAAATSVFILPHNLQGEKWYAFLAFWFVFFAVPLLFVFAYPRQVFGPSAREKSQRLALLLNVLGVATTTFLFPRLALPYPGNPIRDVDSLAIPLVALVALAVFLVAACSLLLKKESNLAIFASILVWPYCLLAALGTLDRYFYQGTVGATYYFLCFLSPIFFAFAAGAISYRPTLGHAISFLAGVLSLPWIYWTVLRDSELVNPWIMFNVPDKEVGMYPMLHARSTILAVALIVLATVTAIFRLLPLQWHLRKSHISDRTWPAYTASLLFLAVWFTQSVMPYRIPGAVNYADYPILQILHLEKRGLQFHETAISVFRRTSFSISGNDRWLLQYRFQQKHAGGLLPVDLMQRVSALVQSPDYAKRESTIIRPIRAWNSDGWYLFVEGSGIHKYASESGTTPPREIVALFHDLEGAPRSPETQSDLKDVCLGFCYDPVSGLGSLYSNHRCFNAGHGTHCR